MTDWRNRITGQGTASPDELLANPWNWRIHGFEQQMALKGTLEDVGWIQNIVANETTGHIIDGHLRAKIAIDRGEKEVPVVYVQLTENEEKIALAAFDSIGAMAGTDQDMLNQLIADIDTDNELVKDLLGDLSTERGEREDPTAEARVSLSEQFLVPPFSVLDGKSGLWRDRKATWMQLGIKSELGREDELTYSASCQPPDVLDRKREIEGKLGYTMSWREFSEKYPEEITLATTSIFDPVLCEVAYRWFAPKGGSILDPFAGGSVRGVVAAFCGYSYTGIDLRGEQITANKTQWQNIGYKHSDNHPVWHQGDSTNIKTLAPGSYDLIFSCPPYADLEVYSDDPADISGMDYPEFMEAYRKIIKETCDLLSDNRFAVWVVGEVRNNGGGYYNFVGDTIKAFEDAGLSYYNEAVFLTPLGSLAMRSANYFRASRKLGKGHQNVLVFAKGEPEPFTVEGIAEVTAQAFAGEKKLLEAAQKVLVFAKGDPKQAAQEFGAPMIEDPLEHMEAPENG